MIDSEYIVIGLISGFYVYAIFTNPQLPISLSRKKFTVYRFFNHRIRSYTYKSPRRLSSLYKPIAWMREAIIIVMRRKALQDVITRITQQKRKYHDIYRSIVREKFNLQHPYLTSGDHFSSFYPRNLGLFYRFALHPECVLDHKDYKNRICLYLNSLHFLCEFYKQQEYTTTIIPLFRSGFIASNIYKKPIDTLLSVLYAFDCLLFPDAQFTPIHDTEKSEYMTEIQRQAREQAMQLRDMYIVDLYEKTLDILSVLSEQSGLVTTRQSFSGIRDGVVRKSSLYDNISVWASISRAIEHGIIDEEDLAPYEKPATLKTRILETFVYQNTVLLHEKASLTRIMQGESTCEDELCADILHAYTTRFLRCDSAEEGMLLLHTIKAFRRAGLLHNHGIQYSRKNPPHTYWLVALTAPSYMGKSVWSHWSVECVLACMELSRQSYVSEEDKKWLIAYAGVVIHTTVQNVEKYQGYPELYDTHGTIFSNIVYASLVRIGWVVNFEYAKNVYEYYEQTGSVTPAPHPHT